MRGFITEKNWKEIDRAFAGLHRFYRHLPRKPQTFLELLELYHAFDEDRPARSRRTLRRCAVLFIVLAALFAAPRAAMAQARPETAPAETAPAESPVGSAVEETGARATLKLLGSNCDMNAVESAMLRVRGVSGVDVESMKGHMLVDYDPKAVTTQQMVDTLARKKNCFAREVK